MDSEEIPPVLKCQLDFLGQEVTTINASIRQIDEITKNIKQWTIVTWAGAVGGALIRPELTMYVGVTAAIPVLFWLVDAYHRRAQRRFIWRTLLIKDFLNDDRLTESFKQGKLVGFEVLDPAARAASSRSNIKAYRKFVSWRRIMMFRTLVVFYAGLALLSLLIWLFTLITTLARS